MAHYRQTTYKNAAEIKAAVDSGVRVFQHNSGYEVIKDSIGQYDPSDRNQTSGLYLIAWLHGTPQAHYIGLTWNDGTTLNGKAWEFYSMHEDDPANS